MNKTTGILLMAMLLMSGLLFAQNKTMGVSSAPDGMAKIPAGYYQPFLKVKGKETKPIKVPSFYMDEHAVTNADFLLFVKANPQWARSKVASIFADKRYLIHWAGDFQIGNKEIANSPVTNVSWFAAKAYAQWKGKRLPTLHEWEYAAQASPVGNAKGQKTTNLILDWYSKPTPKTLPNVTTTYRNAYGLYDMYGLIWEWVYDFNSIMTGGDSRSAGSLDANLYCAAGSLNAVDKEDYASFMRFGFRESLEASYTISSLGFRCAKDAP